MQLLGLVFCISEFMSNVFRIFLWYEGLAIGGIARVGQVQLIQPFCTLLSSNIILGEPLTAMNMMFALSVIPTVILSRKILIQRD